MKIFICSSKYIYDKIPPIKEELEGAGHLITLPNSYEEPMKEEEMKKVGERDHVEWKAAMIRTHRGKIEDNDAILVLNFEKNDIKNYIGGATFLEIYEAFMQNKKIFLYNPIPEGILADELRGFGPIILNGDLSQIK